MSLDDYREAISRAASLRSWSVVTNLQDDGYDPSVDYRDVCQTEPKHSPMMKGWVTPLERELREEVLNLEARLSEQEADFRRRIGQSVNYAIEACDRMARILLQEWNISEAGQKEMRDELLALRADID